MWQRPAGRVTRALSLALTIRALAPGAAAPQDVTWQPTGPSGALSLVDCTRLKSITVELFRLQVSRTPNDTGSYEEWDVSFPYAFLASRVRVKDRLPPPQPEYAIDREWTWPSMPEFVFSVGGQESDLWPNPDDTLPELTIRVVRGCGGESPSSAPPVILASVLRRCATNDDGTRSACYSFAVRFNY